MLQPFAARLVVAGSAMMCLGAAAYYLGLLARTLARWQEAEDHFQAAEAPQERVDARPFLALTWSAHGQLLLAQGGAESKRGERGRILLGQAHALAQELGMDRLATETAAFACTASQGASPTEPPSRERERAHAGSPHASTLPDGLTPREAEILRLLARGLTSKQIAAELVLAVDTVRRHTTNLYTKIGVHGRAEATAYALRYGLPADRAE